MTRLYARRSTVLSRQEQAALYAEATSAESLERQKRAGATRCKKCWLPIRWALTPAGRRMPLDYDEHEGGNVFLFEDGSCVIGDQADPTPAGATRHYSHFQTCPRGTR